MRFGRRVVALSLNVLIIQLAWTGSRGECASAGDPSHGTHSMAMGAMGTGENSGATTIGEVPDATHHGCPANMPGAECVLMTGCATPSLIAVQTRLGFQRVGSDALHASGMSFVPLPAPQPLPPPPRA